MMFERYKDNNERTLYARAWKDSRSIFMGVRMLVAEKRYIRPA